MADSTSRADAKQDAGVDLCLLVSRGDRVAVEACLRETPSLLHRVRWSGVGPLHRAVARGDHELASLLLSMGARVDHRAAWGWYSPLHLACKAGDEKMIWLLLDHGAQWEQTDKYKKSPLQWAVKAGKASVAYRVDQQLGGVNRLELIHFDPFEPFNIHVRKNWLSRPILLTGPAEVHDHHAFTRTIPDHLVAAQRAMYEPTTTEHPLKRFKLISKHARVT